LKSEKTCNQTDIDDPVVLSVMNGWNICGFLLTFHFDVHPPTVLFETSVLALLFATQEHPFWLFPPP